ncbi:MAG TPA: glycosyl hydrolase [Polyangiaceae bacterium]
MSPSRVVRRAARRRREKHGGGRRLGAVSLIFPLLGGCFSSAPDGRATASAPVTAENVVSEYPGPAPLELSEEQDKLTRQAFERLKRTLANLAQESRFAFGHQDTTAYGVGWSGDDDRSDVKSVCGSHPAVYGWDVFKVERGAPQNGDGVDFGLMRERIRDAYRRGGINTVSWHADNPVSGGDAWDTSAAVRAIIPGGSHHGVFRTYLDRVADFLASCRGDRGELIPIIFRPFHEHTGSWFWWGRDHASNEDFVTLFRFTLDYLRETRRFSHLLFAFSPGGGDVRDLEDYLFRYPGDDYVDVMGLDHYYGADASPMIRALGAAVAAADAHGKVPALTEFGVYRGFAEQDDAGASWFSRSFLEPMVESGTLARIAYALAWRNADDRHFFVPYPGHPAATDFARFCADERVLLLRDLAP